MYSYLEIKPSLFSEENQLLFLKVRDRVKHMLSESGAVRMGEAMSLPSGIGAADSFELMACIDRMVEIGDLREVPTHGRGQDRVFVST